MGYSIDVLCDKCDSFVKQGDEIVCETCYDTLETKWLDLINENNDLKERVEALEKEVDTDVEGYEQKEKNIFDLENNYQDILKRNIFLEQELSELGEKVKKIYRFSEYKNLYDFMYHAKAPKNTLPHRASKVGRFLRMIIGKSGLS